LASNVNVVGGQPGATTRLSTPGVGPPFPFLMSPTGFQHSAQYTEFSPLVEWRAEAHCRLTNLISVKGGFTGIWLDGVGRGADLVNWSVANGAPMGITNNVPHGNSQNMLIYGFNIGIELNQ